MAKRTISKKQQAKMQRARKRALKLRGTKARVVRKYAHDNGLKFKTLRLRRMSPSDTQGVPNYGGRRIPGAYDPEFYDPNYSSEPPPFRAYGAPDYFVDDDYEPSQWDRTIEVAAPMRQKIIPRKCNKIIGIAADVISRASKHAGICWDRKREHATDAYSAAMDGQCAEAHRHLIHAQKPCGRASGWNDRW